MKKSNVNIILLKKNLLQLFRNFIRSYWDKNHIFVKNIEFFKWQHKLNKNNYASVIALYKHKIIGVHNYITFNQFDKNLKDKQIFLAIWSSSFNHKLIGVGLSLYKEILKIEKPDFIGSIGYDDKAIDFHKWQKFQMGFMKHFVYISPYLKKFKIATVPQSIKIKLIQNNKKISFKKITATNILRINFKNLFNYQVPIKSKKYLLNRYLKHPIYNYELYTLIKNKNINSVVVLRNVKYKNSSALKIIDFIGPNKNFHYIKYLLNKLFIKKGYEFANIYVHGISDTILKKSNFIEVNKIHKLIIPNYFEPFVRKNILIKYAFKSNQNKRIRIFNADCDQDSPKII